MRSSRFRRLAAVVLSAGAALGALGGSASTAPARAAGTSTTVAAVEVGEKESEIRSALAGLYRWFEYTASSYPKNAPCPFMPFDQLLTHTGPAGLTVTHRGYYVEPQAQEGVGRGASCGSIIQDAYENPDAAAPHAAYMRVWDTTGGSFASFVEFLGVPLNSIAAAPIGGELAGYCEDFGSVSYCLVTWHQRDLAVSLAAVGPGVDRQLVDGLLLTMVPEVIANLSAITQTGGSTTVPTPPATSTVPEGQA